MCRSRYVYLLRSRPTGSLARVSLPVVESSYLGLARYGRSTPTVRVRRDDLAGWLLAGVSHTNQEVGIDRPQAMRERVKQRLTPINGRLVPNKQSQFAIASKQAQAKQANNKCKNVAQPADLQIVGGWAGK